MMRCQPPLRPGVLTPADGAVLLFSLVMLALLLTTARHAASWGLLMAGHLVTLAAIPVVAGLGRGDPTTSLGYLHLWYPVLLLLWFYPEAGALRHSILFDHDLDTLVRAWDAALVPGALHLTLPPLLSSLVLELLHAAYFSYYFLLFVPGMIMTRRHTPLVGEYVFVLAVGMLSHYLFCMLFPVSGPVPARAETMPEGYFFIPLLQGLYGAFDRGGLAFPSTHTASAIIAAHYAGRFLPALRCVFWAQAVLIMLSTVLCTYHYVIDTAAGIVTGTIFLVAARATYRYLREQPGSDRGAAVVAR